MNPNPFSQQGAGSSSANGGGMNINMNSMNMNPGAMNMNMLAAMQKQQQQGFPGTLNPSQLMNGGGGGMGGMNMNMGGINPSQLMNGGGGGMGGINPNVLMQLPHDQRQQQMNQQMHQHHLQQQQHGGQGQQGGFQPQHPGMGQSHHSGSGQQHQQQLQHPGHSQSQHPGQPGHPNANAGNASHPSHPGLGAGHPSHLNAHGAHPASNPGQGQNPGQPQGQPQNPGQGQGQPQINIHHLLATLGMTREQFGALSGAEKQMLGARYVQIMQAQAQHGGQGQGGQQQQQQQGQQQGQGQGQQQQSPHDRPSSSASTHSHTSGQAQMMPPPLRPPTAMSGNNAGANASANASNASNSNSNAGAGGHISRPGTAMSMNQGQSRPGTSMSHRSPTIPGSGPGEGGDRERPGSRSSHHPDASGGGGAMLNGFKQGQTQHQHAHQQHQHNVNAQQHQHQQQQHQNQNQHNAGRSTPNPNAGQANGANANVNGVGVGAGVGLGVGVGVGGQGQQGMQQTLHMNQQNPYPPSQTQQGQGLQGMGMGIGIGQQGMGQGMGQQGMGLQPPQPSTSPTGSRGSKRKVGDMSLGLGMGGMGGMPGGGGGGGMGGMNMQMNMQMNMGGMGGAAGMGGMGNTNPMIGMGMNNIGLGGGGGGGNNNNNMPMTNLGGIGGNNQNMISGLGMNMSNMGVGGGMPGSPRIGGTGGAMGPPGLPRSMSSDGMMGGNPMMSMGGMNNGMGGGGVGVGGGGAMGNMGMVNNAMNMNLGGMGGMGNNLGGMNNMNMGMMNGARGSPRPQSSMGMSGPLGMSGGGGMNNMGMNMGGMSVDSPSLSNSSLAGPRGPHQQQAPQSQNQGQGQIPGTISLGPAPGGPQTPMRQGSLPPQTHTPGPGGGGVGGPQMMQGMGGGMQTPNRQGSLPPRDPQAANMQAQMAMARRTSGTPAQGMGGMGLTGMGMNMNMNMGGAPHQPASPLGGGLGGGGPPMAPSISAASSMNSLGGGGLVPPLSASTGGIIAPTTSLSGSSAAGGPGPGPSFLGAPGSAGGPPTSSTPGLPGSAGVVTGSGATAATNGLAPLPPLPSNVTAALNPHTTVITPIPLLTSLSAIPPVEADEIENIKGWMETDKVYLDRVRTMKIRGVDEIRTGGGGLKWWERGAPGNGTGNWSRFRRGPEPFAIRYGVRKDGYSSSSHRKKEKKREGLKLPRKIDPEDANRPEQLVPIRIEFDVEHHKMRDTFVWNLNDAVVTPEAFAQSIVDDYALAPLYHSQIVKSIQEQLSDYKAHNVKYDADLNELSDTEEIRPLGGTLTVDGAEERWWAGWRKRVVKEGKEAVRERQILSGKENKKGGRSGGRNSRKTRKAAVPPWGVQVKNEDGDDVSMLADDEFPGEHDDDEGGEDEERRAVAFEEDTEFLPLSVDEIKLDEREMHDDMRILIKLDIIVASIKLDDQFEWDLDNPTASPEGFAEVYTQELGLGGEFKTAIAHSIREQVQTYQKSLFLVGHHPTDGAGVPDEDLKLSFLPSLTSGARPVSEVQMFTPLLNYLSDGELERTEKDRDKDLTKRRKRNTRGRRGVALPDREPIRTYRTPAIGFPELDAATLAAAAAANAPMSRRAAAAAASLTIANMVASENGTQFMPQAMPSAAPQPPPQAAAQKEKKPKGLFKAPGCPPSVLRPRAQVVAPTPSTAADVSGMPPVQADNEAPRSSSSALPPAFDPRASKLITAKRAKELEREAKEKEFVDGQHPNYIDGVWHCSNCGCPESIAVGRRKGPLGDKSQCGTCGKFWHRHRRPRPVEYNPDPNFHSGVKQKEADALRTPANKKKGAAAALRAQSAAHSATPAGDDPQTPARTNGDMEVSSRKSPTPAVPKDEDDRAMSPISSASSASEAPLAQKVKLNGNQSAKASSTPVPTPATPVKAEPAKSTPVPETSASASTAAPHNAPIGNTPASPTRTWPPQWLSTQMQLMQAKYPNDRFEVILRKVSASSTAEWRIKCLDCPGKLYTPGPAETLSNYEVHLKNRLHRQRVNDRISGVTTTTAP